MTEPISPRINKVKAEYIWTLPEMGASGPTGGDDGAGGYMPLAMVTGATADINWVHAHHNAKPILLTNATGAVVPYQGIAVLGFPGQFANAVGLAGAQYYYNRYRDYNDATGRYIQADPIGLAGDDNPYAYAMGNPLRYTDPTGEIAWLIPMLAGAAIGAGTDLAFQAAMNAANGRQIFDAGCYDWRSVGISAGLGAFGGAIGAWAGRATPIREFSHWIPARYIRPLSLSGKNPNKYYKPWLDNPIGRAIVNSPLNGNNVSPRMHALTDPFRHLKGMTKGDTLPPALRHPLRVPYWLSGSAAGAGFGTARSASDRRSP
jgi:RHS repeat-associated protein